MSDESSRKYHIDNLAYAAAMKAARRDILDVLCSGSAGLRALGDFYADVQSSDKPIDELVHVRARRFADDDEVAEQVIRSRAGTIAKKCAEFGKGRISVLDRKQLVDEMLDVRLPDVVVQGAPDHAAENKYCPYRDARVMEVRWGAAPRRLIAARKQMVDANMPLVDRFLYGYKDRPDYKTDIYSEGVIGLINAAERWDKDGRLRFSTYAKEYVLGHARKHTDESVSAVHIPRNIHQELDAMQRVETEFLARAGFIPSSAYVAQEMGVQPKTVQKWRNIDRPGREFDHSELYDKTDRAVSKHPPRFYNAEPALLDARFSEQAAERIGWVLRTLTPREERVIKMRFGLDEGLGYDNDYTLKEVGEQFRVTAEMARRIEAKALGKLRNPNRTRQLEPLIAPR